MRSFRDGESGQALIDVSITAFTLIILTLGIVDFGRATHAVQVIKNLAGEGSSLASRGSDAATAAQTVNDDGGTGVSMSTNGCVVVTIVTNQAGTLAITDQAYNCHITAASKIGCLKGVNGCQSSTPTLPSAAQNALSSEPNGSILGVTEIYYRFNAITPVSRLLGSGALPSPLYTAAYY